MQSICLLIVVGIAIGVSVARSSGNSLNAQVDGINGSLLPLKHPCTSDGTTISCGYNPKPKPSPTATATTSGPSTATPSPASQPNCTTNPTASGCLKNGAECPDSVAGMVAQNRNSTEFECKNHIWRRVEKPVTSGES